MFVAKWNQTNHHGKEDERLSICLSVRTKLNPARKVAIFELKTVDARNQKHVSLTFLRRSRDFFFLSHLIEECERRKSHPNLINVNLIRNSNKCVRLQNDCKIDAKEKRASHLYFGLYKKLRQHISWCTQLDKVNIYLNQRWLAFYFIIHFQLFTFSFT